MTRFRVLGWASAIVLYAAIAAAQNNSVSGRVTDAQGGALANAEVTLRPQPAPGTPVMANMPGMNDRTVPATGGSFTIDQIMPGNYVLFADAPGYERSSQAVTIPGNNPPLTISLTALELPGAATVENPGPEPPATAEVLLDRIKTLEQRIADLESTTVLSEPETRVKRIDVYVDENGNQHDEPVAGAKRQTTYQRERVYRRQAISEKIEEAIASAEEHTIKVGVSAASVTQFASQNEGPSTEADGNAYQLASADLFFAGGIAQYTSFFADIVGLSGAPPDAEIQGLTLLNSYTARLVRQNEVNVREAWVRTELFSQKLALTAGRLDLTNFVDRNAGANDETVQFISDALVNNPMLGLTSNGAGVAGVFDPKIGFVFKAGFQQSNTDATNLSDSIFTLGEIDYVARPPGLSEGNYRFWFRNDNSTGTRRNGLGISIDQKLIPRLMLFGRYGSAEQPDGRDHFYSVGFQIQDGWNINPLDIWGIGYSQTDLDSDNHERLVEGYYNFRLSERLRLSFHLAHTFQDQVGDPKVGYFVPAIRLQASF